MKVGIEKEEEKGKEKAEKERKKTEERKNESQREDEDTEVFMPECDREPLSVQSLLKRIDELEEEVRREREYAEEYKRKWMYTFSEFENYRRRVARDVEEEVRRHMINVFSNFISCVDSIDSAVRYIHDENVRQGIELIKKIIFDALFKSGVREIEVKEGEHFSPEKCEAIGFEEKDDVDEGKILKVLRKGFEYGGKVIRPAQVVVAKRRKREEKEEKKH